MTAEVCPETGLPFQDRGSDLACPACTGEGCYLCGAGIWFAEREPCDHDVVDRHEGAPRYRPHVDPRGDR